MINVVLVGENLNCFKELINNINIINQNIRICGISNDTKEINYLTSKQYIDFFIVDFDLYNNNKLLKQWLVNKNNIVYILNASDKKDTITKDYSCVIIDENIKCAIEQINLLIIEKIALQGNNKNIHEEKIIRAKIIQEVNKIGYSFSHLGTQYIIECIYILYIMKNYIVDNLERNVYPIVAKKFGNTSHNIKCNIRNATDLMYLNNKEEELKKYFGVENIESFKSKKIIRAILNKINNI